MNADSKNSDSISDQLSFLQEACGSVNASADASSDSQLNLAPIPAPQEPIVNSIGDSEVSTCIDTMIVSPGALTAPSSVTPVAVGDLGFSQPIAKALVKLLRAYRYSNDCQRSRWDFAVEINELRHMGISSEELRWLIGKNLIDHAEESSAGGQTRRAFASPGGFSLSKRSCFVLTDEGIKFAGHQSILFEKENRMAVENDLPHSNHSPNWDKIRHELRVGDTLVKKFKWRAANQEAILCAFQEEGWPPHIDDPLPPLPEKDPKRRLSDAIKCLNRKQLNPVVRFCGDGTGEGVLWEFSHSR